MAAWRGHSTVQRLQRDNFILMFKGSERVCWPLHGSNTSGVVKTRKTEQLAPTSRIFVVTRTSSESSEYLQFYFIAAGG